MIAKTKAQIIFGTVIGLISKAVLLCSQLLSIRLVSELAGKQGYAIWVLCGTLMAWFSLSDGGIASILQNKVAEARAKNKVLDDEVKIATRILFYYIAPVFLIGLLFSPVIYRLIISVNNNLSLLQFYYLLIIVIVSGYFTAIANVQTKIWMALGRSVISQFLPAILSISMLSIAYYLRINNVISNVSEVIILTVMFPMGIMAFIYFFNNFQSFKCLFKIKFDLNSGLCKTGIHFFLFALTANFVLQIDTIIAAWYLKSEDIVRLGLMMKLLAIFIVGYNVMLSNAAPKLTGFWIKKDKSSIKKLMFELVSFGLIACLLFSLFLFLFFDEVSAVLLKGNVIKISNIELMLFCVYLSFRVISDVLALALTSATKLKIFAIVIPLQAIVNVSAQIVLTPLFGVSGIVSGIIISYVIANIWILPLNIKKVLRFNS